MSCKQKIIRYPNANEQVMKEDALKTMRNARIEMLMRFPFLGELAMQLDITPILDERLPIACTDGKIIYVNAYAIEHPEKVFKQQFRERKLKGKEDTAIAILAHEVWHCALLHFDRCKGKEAQRFNIAADIEIGYLVEKAKITDLSVAKDSFGDMLKGYPAERIYNMLQLKITNNRSSQLTKSENTIRSSSSIRDTSKEKDKDCNNGNCENNQSQFNADDKINEKFVKGHYSKMRSFPSRQSEEAEYGNRNIFDPDFTPIIEQSIEECDELRTKWQDSTRKIASRHHIPGYQPGNYPGNLQDIINDKDTNKIDWKQVLIDYVTQTLGGDRRWLPPNRRYVWKNLYLPKQSKKETIEIVLAIDTSGSTIGDLQDFLAELRGIAATFGEYNLTIIQCDTCIRSVKEYSNDDPITENGLTFCGFGGTSLIPPFRYVDKQMLEKPTVFIYMTDGYGPVPSQEPDYPVIWCLTKENRSPANWGVKVCIT